MPKMRSLLLYGFVTNLIGFPAVQFFFENQLRFDTVTESLNVETFLGHSVVN